MKIELQKIKETAAGLEAGINETAKNMPPEMASVLRGMMAEKIAFLRRIQDTNPPPEYAKLLGEINDLRTDNGKES